MPALDLSMINSLSRELHPSADLLSETEVSYIHLIGELHSSQMWATFLSKVSYNASSLYNCSQRHRLPIFHLEPSYNPPSITSVYDRCELHPSADQNLRDKRSATFLSELSYCSRRKRRDRSFFIPEWVSYIALSRLSHSYRGVPQHT